MEDRDILIYLHSLFLNGQYLDKILELDRLEDILYMDEEELRAIPNSTDKSVEKILLSRSKDYINEMVENINKHCVEVLTIFDEDFPIELQLIENPPKVLYVKGLPLDMSGAKIGVVGSRKCTAYGKFAVEKFVSQLADLNATIISGMAQGIDSLAHQTALDHDTYSIGVLGTGVDIMFPARNKKLYSQMYEAGTIISEYPIGAGAQPYNFPARNRIISGLSDGVIVIEAKDKSGSLITARLAAEQGKEVFSVPGNINSVYSVGTNKLIRDGAIPLIELEDITIAIPGLRDIEAQVEDLQFCLSEDEILLLSKIEEGIDTIDSLVAATGLGISKLNSALALLEMKGIIQDLGATGIKKL